MWLVAQFLAPLWGAAGRGLDFGRGSVVVVALARRSRKSIQPRAPVGRCRAGLGLRLRVRCGWSRPVAEP